MAKTSAVLARRNELARERGFKSYADQRKQFSYAMHATGEGKGQASYRKVYGKPNARNPSDVQRVKRFYRAFKQSPDNYGPNSPKRQWFTQDQAIMERDDWEERYPRGVRE